MGDRISISFKTGESESVVLFSHWGGMGFLGAAEDYAKDLVASREGHMMPLDRFEPGTVMIDFIRHITKRDERVESNLYLGATSGDGDNSDNGHFRINLPSLQVEKR